jgi:hypothetical protein
MCLLLGVKDEWAVLDNLLIERQASKKYYDCVISNV